MWKFAVVSKKAAIVARIVAGGAAVAAYSAYEWRKATEKLGGGKHLDDSQADRIFAEIDKDGSGAIDAVELQAATSMEKAGLGSNAVGLMLNAATASFRKRSSAQPCCERRANECTATDRLSSCYAVPRARSRDAIASLALEPDRRQKEPPRRHWQGRVPRGHACSVRHRSVGILTVVHLAEIFSFETAPNFHRDPRRILGPEGSRRPLRPTMRLALFAALPAAVFAHGSVTSPRPRNAEDPSRGYIAYGIAVDAAESRNNTARTQAGARPRVPVVLAGMLAWLRRVHRRPPVQ